MVEITYKAIEVNPANTGEFGQEVRRGDTWSPTYVAAPVVARVQRTDEPKHLYRKEPDGSPPPQPDGSYNPQIVNTFQGVPQAPAAFVQENITWVQRDALTLFEEVVLYANNHRDFLTLGDEETLAQARLTYSGQDYWVPTSRGAQFYYNGVDLWLRNKQVPANHPVPVIIERVSNGNIIFPGADEALWVEFTKLLGEDFLVQAQEALITVYQEAEAFRDADDRDGLWSLLDEDGLAIRAKWSTPVAGSFVTPDTFSVPGDHTAALLKGTQVELQQAAWVWGRVHEATFDGSLTTCELRFRNSDVLANAALQVSWDERKWPEYRAWIPGQDSSDPARRAPPG